MAEGSTNENYDPTTYAFISETMNELAIYIMLGLGFFLLQYLADVAFDLISNLILPRFYNTLRPEPEEEAKSSNDDTLMNYLKTNGYCQLTGAVHLYNIYLRNKGVPKNEALVTIFEKMKRQGIAPNNVTYNILLYVYMKEGMFDMATELFYHCRQPDSEVHPDLVSFNTYFKGLVLNYNKVNKRIDLEMVSKLLGEMKRLRINPNAITYNTIIDLCITMGYIKEAWNYFNGMKDEGLSPDLFTYSTLFKGLKVSPLIYQPYFDSLFKSLEVYSKPLDIVLLNTIMDTAILYKDSEKINIILDYMNKHNIQPSNVTYGILIRAFSQNGIFENSLSMLKEMKSKGIKPNEIIYGCIIDSCIKARMYTKAEEFLQEMNTQQIPINIVIYTMLLKGYTKERNFTRIWELYTKIAIEHKVYPNIIFYNAILEAVIQCSRYDLIMEVYERITKENSKYIIADVITYATILKGLCKAQYLDKAFKVYKKIRKEKVFHVEEVIYTTLMHGYYSIGKYKECEDIHKDMLSTNIKVTEATYNILAKLYKKTGEYEKTVKLYKEVKPRKMSLAFWTCILQICIKAKQIEKAIQIFEDLHARLRNELDQVIYNTIVSGCIFSGHLTHACMYTVRGIDDDIVMVGEVYARVVNNILTSRTMDTYSKRDYLGSIMRYLDIKKINVNSEVKEKAKRLLNDAQYHRTKYECRKNAELKENWYKI